MSETEARETEARFNKIRGLLKEAVYTTSLEVNDAHDRGGAVVGLMSLEDHLRGALRNLHGIRPKDCA